MNRLIAKVAPVSNLLYYGTNTPKILFIMEPPKAGATSPIEAKQYELLSASLAPKGSGVKRADVAFLSCAAAGEYADTASALKAHLALSKDEFAERVAKLNPKLLVACGKTALQQLAGKSVAITKLRGVLQTYNGLPCKVLPIFSPSHVLFRNEVLPVFNADCAAIRAMLLSDSYAGAAEVETDYRWASIGDLDYLIQHPPERIGLDVETTGLDWFRDDAKLLTVQISAMADTAIVIPIDYSHSGINAGRNRQTFINKLKVILENPKTQCVGANLKFDIHFLREKLNINVANYAGDTLLLAHNIDENMQGKSIDDCTRVYLPRRAGYNDKYNNDPDHQGKSRMDLFPPHKMLEYAAGDADIGLQLFHAMRDIAAKDTVNFNCYEKVVMPAMRAFCRMEPRGQLIDTKALHELELMLAESQTILEARLLSQIPDSIKNEYKETGVGLKLSRDAFLRAVLFTHKDGFKLTPVVFTDKSKLPSVAAKTHLPYFLGTPFVVELIEYLKADTMLNTFIRQFDKYIYNGKVYPSYNLHIAVTGRTSSSNPNSQSLPKRGKYAKAYNKIFIAPPGYVILAADYSQIELRIAAVVAKDAAMLEVYRKAGDIHTETAITSLGITREQFLELPGDIRSLQRFRGKAVNFGFIYGMWHKKFRDYAKTEYGVDYTEKEAKATRDAFFRKYKGIGQWHIEARNLAMRQGYMRALDGRTRHLPSVYSDDKASREQALRQSINSPVQALASDMGLIALATIEAHVSPKILAPFRFVHDAIYCLAPVNCVGIAARLLKKHMENIPLKALFNIEFPIPIVAEVEYGLNAGEMKEMNSAVFESNKYRTYAQIKLLK